MVMTAKYTSFPYLASDSFRDLGDGAVSKTVGRFGEVLWRGEVLRRGEVYNP